jgi:cytochrome P450
VRRADPFPPGPSSRLAATLRFARDPFGYFAACRARYGDPFTLPLLGTRVVVTGQPDRVRAIYALPPAKVGGLLGHLMPEILGPSSVLVLSGEPHAADRKLLMPMFHGERITAYGRIIAEVTRAQAARHAPGAPLRMYELGRAISLDVILRALFGVEDPARVAALGRAVVRLAESGAPALIFFRALRRSVAGLGPWARVERRLAELDVLLYQQIAERRARPAGEDLLSLLIAARYDDGSALSDAQIRDQLMSLILAGHETMAVTLAWGMHWILAEPAVRARLDAELATDGDPGRIPYLDAVCKETLRIYPIQPIVMRHLLEPLEVAERALPAGSFVGAATTLVHMDPALYPEPERFRPERFLEHAPSTAEFFPFGGGARRCLGAAFALYEMKVVLATLCREFRFRLASPSLPRPIRQSTVMGPSGGVPLVRAA